MKYRYWFHRERDDVAATFCGWRGEGVAPNSSPLVETGRQGALAQARMLASQSGETIVVKRQQGLGPAMPIATVKA